MLVMLMNNIHSHLGYKNVFIEHRGESTNFKFILKKGIQVILLPWFGQLYKSLDSVKVVAYTSHPLLDLLPLRGEKRRRNFCSFYTVIIAESTGLW